MDLTVTVETQGACAVARVSGEIDAFSSPALREILHDLTDQGHGDVVVDLADAPFVDSTGLGVLVGGLKRQRAAGGTLRLAGLNGRVMKVFRVTGLDSVFPIHPDVDTALGAAEC